MNKESQKIIGLFSRYVLIVLLGLGNIYLLYAVLTPLTISALSLILPLFGKVIIQGISIKISYYTINIVPACVAGAAFYLLFILLFSTPGIKPRERINILIFSFVTLFILNVARIIVLIFLLDKPYFEVAHWIFWNIISTVFVVGIWVAVTFIYRLKAVPIFSDVKYLVSLVKKAK